MKHNFINTSDQPKLVFIAGSPRSGGTVTLASFDSHPDILCWPFEFLYFSFFCRVAQGRITIPVEELNSKIDEEFKAGLPKQLKATNIDYSRDNIKSKGFTGFNINGFNYQFFLEYLDRNKSEIVNAAQYLRCLFEALKMSSDQYKNKTVKYYFLLTTARGIDWKNTEIYENSYFLYNYRTPSDVYGSLKSKYFKSSKYSLKAAFSLFHKKNFFYWIETFRRIGILLENNKDNKNFMLLPLIDLQKKPGKTLQKICNFLGVAYKPSLANLSVIGIVFNGGANQDNLNTGKISSRTSNITVELCSFEIQLFNYIGALDPITKNKGSVVSLSLYSSLKNAFCSAFRELPSEKILFNKNGLINVFIGRVFIFLNFCGMCLLLKNRRLTKFIIRKYNPHINTMPFWND
jgi:hypothetical protein